MTYPPEEAAERRRQAFYRTRDHYEREARVSEKIRELEEEASRLEMRLGHIRRELSVLILNASIRRNPRYQDGD